MLLAVRSRTFLLLVSALTVAACAVDRSGTRSMDAATPPAVDAQPPDGSDAQPPPDTGPPDRDGGGSLCGWPYAPEHFDPCGSPGGEAEVMLTDTSDEYVYDTDLGRLREPGGTPTPVPNTVQGGVHIWWTGAFTLAAGARLRVVGPQPLLIAANGNVTIEGTIDASSFFDGAAVSVGAGADPRACDRVEVAPTPGTTCGGHAGSGGGGGGFGGRGGDGGDVTGRGCPGGDDSGGSGGAPLGGVPTTLRGGCDGADGATNNQNDGTTGRGIAGAGGGAVQITAAGSLTVSGTLHAGGAGGSGAYDATGGSVGGRRGGGGGGGSGGMVALEGQDIDIQLGALLVANGGGGGGGTDTATADRGQDGPAAIAFAEGGNAPDFDNATHGGAGGWREREAGVTADPTNSKRGTGGGGGGVGFVVLYNHGPMLSISESNFSPRPEQMLR